MYKLCAIAGTLLGIAGCASAPEVAESSATPAVPPGGPTAAAVKVVDLADFKEERTTCEDLTRPGSRIVVARRCRPLDEEAIAEQLNQVRRDQDTLDRLAREREQRRGGF